MIRSCGNNVYKVEKSKEDTWEPWKFRSRIFSMISEEFFDGLKIIHISNAKGTYVISWSLTVLRVDAIGFDRMVVKQWLEFDMNLDL